MAIYPMLLLLIVTGQERPKPDSPEERARRAAIVDRIMAEPSPPGAISGRPVVEHDPAELARQAALEKKRYLMEVRGVGGPGQPARWLTIELPVAEARDGEIDPPEPVAPLRLNLANAVLERENFDRWIFGDGWDEESRRMRLHSLLAEEIGRAMKDYDINTSQLRKLRLAGGGDIKRFLDRVEERRPEFEVARRNYATGRQLLVELAPLSAEFRKGPFGNKSLFVKTLKKIENDSRKAPEQPNVNPSPTDGDPD